MMLPLARPALGRMTRSPRALTIAAAWLALAVLDALLERRHTAGHGADGALIGGFGGIALPLLALGVVTSLAPGGLAAVTRPLVTLGARPSRAALGTIGVAIASCAAAGLVFGPIVLALAGTTRPLLGDATTSAWVCGLGGATYAALFCLGSSIGRTGWGASMLLLVDWVLGSSHGALSVCTPRAHLRSLLGGVAPLDLAQGWSSLALVALAASFAALAIQRAARAS